MRADLFWFDDEQWSKVQPHLPTNQQGPARHDDRRILSGIMHVQKVGCRWKDCPRDYGPHKTIYNRFCALERARNLASHLRGSRGIFRDARSSVARQQPCENPSLRQRRKRGAQAQAIGITKGGRNSKIHAVVDALCRPWVLILTPGHMADCVMAEACVSLIPGVTKLLADKGYDTDAFRAFLKENHITPVIPGKSNRKKPIRYDKETYKGRNVVERCFCRLKDFRRIATRYDKLARNFFSAICFVATLAYWL